MVKYDKAVIYKLCCKDTDITDIYIGSTTVFARRKNHHKKACNNVNDKSHNYPVYKYIREHGGFENWDMIQVEQYVAKNKKDLESRERYWIEQLKPTLNHKIPTRTKKEWYEANKEQISVKAKEYRENNKEQILVKKKEYREANKEQILVKAKEYRENNKEQISVKAKEYRENNKEQIAVKKKEWYEANKEQIEVKAKEKVTCDCGSTVSRSALLRHRKSKKHQRWI